MADIDLTFIELLTSLKSSTRKQVQQLKLMTERFKRFQKAKLRRKKKKFRHSREMKSKPCSTTLKEKKDYIF